MFFYLPSTTDQKDFSSSDEDFIPNNLDLKNEKGDSAVEILSIFFKHGAEVSNSNLLENANRCLSKCDEMSEDFLWVGPSKKCFDSTKFKFRDFTWSANNLINPNWFCILVVQYLSLLDLHSFRLLCKKYFM